MSGKKLAKMMWDSRSSGKSIQFRLELTGHGIYCTHLYLNCQKISSNMKPTLPRAQTQFDLMTGVGHNGKCRQRDKLRESPQRGHPPSPAALLRGRRPLAAGQVDVQDAKESDQDGEDSGGRRRREGEKAGATTGKSEVGLICVGGNPRVS